MSISAPVAIVTIAMLIFTCLFGTSIAIYALWRIFYKNSHELQNVDRITVRTAASCIILHALTGILDPFGYYFFYTNQQQAAIIIWLPWDILWTLAKLNLYFVYIYRCYITFKGTKYAHSTIKLYVPSGIAWILQLFNCIVFVFHKLDDADLLKDSHNPLSNDGAVLIASSIYLILDIIIVLCVMFSFLNPIIKLMVDLRTESQKLMKLHSEQAVELVKNDIEASSSELTLTTAHSPTKMGAAYYYKSNKKRKKGEIAVPTTSKHQPSNAVSEATMTTVDTLKMKKFERLQCPEDEEKEMEQLKPLEISDKIKSIVWNEKQIKILNTGTRLALLSLISLSSGFIYQFLWIISVDAERLGNVTYTWGIDTTVNIVCIYLSFQFAVKEYDIVCSKCCRCHGCCLKCVQRMARKRVA